MIRVLPRRAALAAALAAAVLAPSARGDEPRGQGAPPAPAASPAPSPLPSPWLDAQAPAEEGNPSTAIAGRGGTGHVVFEGDDGSLAVLNRVQFRWTDERPDADLQLPGTSGPGVGKGSFRIRRAKTEFTGWVWRKDLTYELQLSWAGPEPGTSTTSPLEDFLITWDVSKGKRFQVTVGQFKVPLGRQELTSSNKLEFADRDLLSGEFTRGRDIGIQLWGELAKGRLEYRAGIFNGNAASRLENDNDTYQYNARVTFQPWGDVKYSESDFESAGHPLLAVSAQYERNNLHHATNADDYDTRILGGDVVFKYGGLFAFAEYFGRHRVPETSAPFDSDGFHGELGYMLIRDRLEAGARYARYDPSSLIPKNDRSEVGGVVNYYLRKHLLKLQADYRRLRDEARDTTNGEVRAQMQIVF